MSCTSCVSQAQQSELALQISVAVARKRLEAARVQGDAIVELLQAAAEPRAPRPDGRGSQFEAVA